MFSFKPSIGLNCWLTGREPLICAELPQRASIFAFRLALQMGCTFIFEAPSAITLGLPLGTDWFSSERYETFVCCETLAFSLPMFLLHEMSFILLPHSFSYKINFYTLPFVKMTAYPSNLPVVLHMFCTCGIVE